MGGSVFIVFARDERAARTLALERFDDEERATARLAELTQQYWDEAHVRVEGVLADSVEAFLAEHPGYAPG
jgi:hypothetical protein